MIGRTNGGSGGASLNFKIVAYTDENSLLQATPPENTIGVITGAKITSWTFSVEAPADPVDGMLWIQTGTASAVAFNAVKKNGIEVYPISAKQGTGTSWVDVTCKSYQNGEWADWWNGELYIDGDQFEAVTGGWWNNPNLYWNSSYKNGGQDLVYDKFLTVPAANGRSTCATTRNKIDMSSFDELAFEFASDSSTPPSTSSTVVIHDVEAGQLADNYIAASNSGQISLAGVSGLYYVTVLSVNNRTMKVGNIRLK